MKVSVVVVNWNGKDLLKKCLSSLQEQTLPPQRIVVVDNGSTDGSSALVRGRFPAVELVQLSRNEGFAAAANAGIRVTGDPFVALLNNDAVADARWLEKLCTALEQDPRAGMAASKMLFLGRPDLIDRAGDGYSTWGVGVLRGRGLPRTDFTAVERIFGACAGAACYRRCMLDEIGLFDPDFFLLYEDVDLSFRAQLMGYDCLFVPEALVYHAGSASLGMETPTAVYYGHRNCEWVYLANMPPGLLLRSLGGHAMYNALCMIYFLRKGTLAPFLRAKIDAFLGLGEVLRKRSQRQRMRRVTEREIMEKLTPERPLERLAWRAAIGDRRERPH
ncbi:MAG: putative glycosyltransferase [Desulfacinum sp.]|jgi:hypothetical protein|nr:putative glycosyltransferase [Desulfacinum sp.]